MSDLDFTQFRSGSELLKRGFARMQQGGVIMDVVNAEQAAIAEDSGAVAVMALERVPADIRKQGGVARMSHPDMIQGILDCTSIPVMAKSRIGHEGESRILESMGVDMIDESEVLTPADPFFHISKKDFEIPFVCGATSLGEAVRRISEGAAMIRTKGEAGTGNVVSAVKHARIIQEEISYLQRATDEEMNDIKNKIMAPFQRINDSSELNLKIENTPFGSLEDCQINISNVIKDIQKLGRLPVVTFSAGGIATPADAALMMNMGMDGIFVGSGIFKSENPTQTAEAIVYATHHFDDPSKVTEASTMVGEAMQGLEIEKLDVKMEKRGW